MFSEASSSKNKEESNLNEKKNERNIEQSELNCQRCNFLLRLSLCEIDEVLQTNNTKEFKLYRISLQKPFGDWRDLIVQWWNQFVDFGYSNKFPALYLYGCSNTGKTYFLRNFILKDIKQNQIFVPSQSNVDTAWASWSEGIHAVGLVEEFKLSVLGTKNAERLSDLIAGKGFFIPFKNEMMFVKGRIPLIYTSNVSLECANGKLDPEIASRFLQIDSNGKSCKRIKAATEDTYRHMFKEEVIL
jgi:hypothetical protein